MFKNLLCALSLIVLVIFSAKGLVFEYIIKDDWLQQIQNVATLKHDNKLLESKNLALEEKLKESTFYLDEVVNENEDLTKDLEAIEKTIVRMDLQTKQIIKKCSEVIGDAQRTMGYITRKVKEEFTPNSLCIARKDHGINH